MADPEARSGRLHSRDHNETPLLGGGDAVATALTCLTCLAVTPRCLRRRRRDFSADTTDIPAIGTPTRRAHDAHHRAVTSVNRDAR